VPEEREEGQRLDSTPAAERVTLLEVLALAALLLAPVVLVLLVVVLLTR
jgi:hypothetical protein